MTYYADLTPYTYSDKFRGGRPEPNTVNVGWLEGNQPYPVGETSQLFRERLWQFRCGGVNVTRGIHICTICQNLELVTPPNRKYRVGGAEIRVFYKGNIYASPDMIYHYVVDHQYKPPDEFIEAVLYGELPDSTHYRKLISQLGVDYSYFKYRLIK